MTDTRCHETMLDDAKGVEADDMEARARQEAYDAGFNTARNLCLHLLAKWFFFNKEEPRECRKEMQALQPQPQK